MTSALTRVDVDTVSTLEAQFVKEVAQSSTHTPSPQTLFNYGWVLSKSPATADVNKGIKMLEELLVVAPSYRREALHFLAEAHFTVGDYPRAREYNEELLVIEPKNQQAMDLRVLIHDRIANGTRDPRLRFFLFKKKNNSKMRSRRNGRASHRRRCRRSGHCSCGTFGCGSREEAIDLI